MITDDFNRSDSGNLGSNWTTFREGGLQIVSNQARGTDSGVYNGVYYSGSSWNSNHTSQAKFGNLGGDTTEQSGPAVRIQSGSGHFYWLFVQSTQSRAIIFYFNGSFNALQTINGLTIADDDVWKLEATGTTLKAYQNGSQIGTDQTDSNLSGGSPGIVLFSDIAGLNYADDWEGTGEVAAATITVTSPAQYQVFQRDGLDEADIAITGTYTGTPTAIEADFNGGGFATIDGSPSVGSFSGTLTGQAAGRGTLTVRFTNDTDVSDTVSDVGIGDVFVVAGDSIAEGRGTNAQEYTADGTNTASAFNESDQWIDGDDPVDTGTSSGSHWPLLATLIMADQSVPVAFITVGTGSTDVYGSGSDQWADGNTNYNALLAQVEDAGTGGVKAVLFHLGPNAIVNGTTPSQANYNAAIDALAAGIADDVDGSPPIFVGLCGEVGTGTPPDRRAAQDNVRMAIKEAWGDNANVKPGPVLIEQDYSDDVHPQSDAELLVVARRWWVCLKESLYGGAAGFGRGPRVSGNITIDAGLDTIVINYDRDLASGTTYGGFRVEDSGTPATITSATRTGTRQVTIVLDSAASAAGNVTVSFGSNDDAKGQTVPTSAAITLPDANTITLPAEPFVDVAVVAGGGGNRRRRLLIAS